jgi:YidC/Oxa1 family membrane protein insertase
MEIWNFFISIITQSIQFISSEIGLGESLAIILFTVIGRLILMPINWSAMTNSYRNKQAMLLLKPELEKIKTKHQNNTSEVAKATMALYKKHNIKIMDKTSVMNIAGQSVFGFGMFQALQQLVFNSKFAWIVNIAKPDLALAIIVGVITYLSMAMMPGSADQVNILLFVIPAIICTIMLINFPSALGLYWATSSTISLLQSVMLKKYFQKQAF